jgi:Mesyanzhinovviridae DNA helicase
MPLHLQTELYAHQREAVERARRNPVAFAHLAETGCGKSVAVLAEWQERLGPDDLLDLLVIAPKGSLRNWYVDRGDDPCELRRHLDPRLTRDLVVADNRPGAARARARERLLAEKRFPRALFVNVEALSLGRRSKAEKLCAEFLTSRKRAMLVVDESTVMRNRSAERTRSLLRLGQLARSRRILTGLVTPRSPLDLFAQFNFLDPRILGCSNFTVFRSRYADVRVLCREPDALIDLRLQQTCRRRRVAVPNHMTRTQKVHKILELGGWIQHAPIVEGYKNLSELRRRIAPYSHQVLKSQCLDLPPKNYVVREVELTDEQRRVYDEVRDDATSQLRSGSHVTALTALAQITRLQQVAFGYVRDEEGKLHDIESGRAAALLEALEEHEGKAVIWTVHQPEVRQVREALAGKYGEKTVALFTGGNADTRAEDEKRFLSDPECRFMVATAAGARGNTWVVADLVIYAANSWDLEFRHQSEDRSHRIGQRRAVTYVDLVAPDTVDELILRALRRKIDLTREITGENWRDWVI